MENKINIAYLTKDMPVNGISTVIMNYCRNIDSSKYKITIFSGAPIDEQYEKECEKLNISIVKIPSKKKKTFSYYKCLLNKLNNKDFDIIHIHGNSATVTMELLIAYIKRIPVRIVHSHNSTCEHVVIHKILRPIFNRLCNYGFACSELAGKWMFKNKSFEIIPNGFEIEKFKFNKENREYLRKTNGLDGKFVIGHIGRFNNQKNHVYLLKVFEIIAQKNENAMLLLVGTGPDEYKIKNIIEQHSYKNKIILYGVTEKVSDIYDMIDIFVFPSKYEGLGIVLLEAQIKGLQCVSSNVVPSEVIISNNVKLLELNDNYDKWADEILNVQEINRQIFYEENYNKIKQYDIKENAKNLMNKYRKLIEKK